MKKMNNKILTMASIAIFSLISGIWAFAEDEPIARSELSARPAGKEAKIEITAGAQALDAEVTMHNSKGGTSTHIGQIAGHTVGLTIPTGTTKIEIDFNK